MIVMKDVRRSNLYYLLRSTVIDRALTTSLDLASLVLGYLIGDVVHSLLRSALTCRWKSFEHIRMSKTVVEFGTSIHHSRGHLRGVQSGIWRPSKEASLGAYSSKRIKMADNQEVKVLGSWACSFTHQVELALKLKGVAYDHTEQDAWKNNPLVLDSNPLIPFYKKDVPLLLHNGKLVPESLFILDYIEDTWSTGYSLLPKDPQEKAYARLLAKFIGDKIIPNFRKACWLEGEEQKRGMEETKENLKILEGEIKGKKFFGGDDIGLVDIAANYVAFWTGVVQKVTGVSLINEENHSNLLKWSQRFLSSDVVKGTLPDREELTALYQAARDAILAKKALSAN
ncbi:probable glutathione S-transferase [Asparagus officinalis]|uniref:probable glutathione S-transferase n=1 Tax=Asparagus officinalis TaxID=4686 RepID=UPI00098E79CD|nr:probable glutathione S-transferase [Asparagus officinalis]